MGFFYVLLNLMIWDQEIWAQWQGCLPLDHWGQTLYVGDSIFLSSFHILYFPVYLHISAPPPSIGFLTVCHHPILTPPSPLAKVLPCPTGSHISTQYLTHSLFINLTVEAVSTSETSICFCETTQCNIPEGCHLHTCHHLIIRHSATLNWVICQIDCMFKGYAQQCLLLQSCPGVNVLNALIPFVV
jgi:hypothetical protein